MTRTYPVDTQLNSSSVEPFVAYSTLYLRSFILELAPFFFFFFSFFGITIDEGVRKLSCTRVSTVTGKNVVNQLVSLSVRSGRLGLPPGSDPVALTHFTKA